MSRSTPIRALAALAVGALTVTGLATPAFATPQGCTPGYWKNHTQVWSSGTYQPDMTVGDVFDNEPSQLSDWTLLEALQGGGGPGELGAAKILLRAATASLLNLEYVSGFAGSDGPLGVLFQTNQALAGSRADMLEQATIFDDKNNAPGGCPLN